MADKTVIVEIQYDTDTAIKSLNSLTDTIEENKKQQYALKKAYKDGTVTQEQYSQSIAELKTEQQKANTERKNTINLLQSEKGSVNQLKAQIKDLTLKRDKLNQSTVEGKKQAQVYNKQIQDLKVSLKGASTETKTITGAFGKFGKDLNSLPGPIGGVVRGIGGMTKAAIAFIATPLGAVIAAIVLGFKALMTYLKGSEEGQNRLTKVTMVFKTIMGNLGDIVQKFGKALYEAFTSPKEAIKQLGEFIQNQIQNRLQALANMGTAIAKIFSKEWKQGFKDLGNSFVDFQTGVIGTIDKVKAKLNEVNEEMSREVAITKQLADRQAALDKLQRSFMVEREKMEAQIADARVKAADKENFTAEERIKFLEDSLKIEEQILNTDLKIAREKFEIKKAQNALSNSTKEDLDEQAQLEAEMFRVQRENAQKRMALTSQLTSARRELNKEEEKATSETEKQNEVDEKAQEDILKRRGESIAKLAELKAQELEKEAETYEEQKEIQIARAEEELAMKLEQDGILHEERELAEYEHKLRLAEIEQGYQDNIAAMRQRELDEARANMQAIINTTAGFANQRVNILTSAFAKIATINYKEVKSASDAFKQIGIAASGLTDLLISGNEAQLADFEAKKQAELEAAGDNTEAREQIERNYNKKLVKLKKAQAKEEKKKAIIDATIATALAVLSGLQTKPFMPNGLIMAGVAGLLGGIQIATIGRQQIPEFSSDKVFADGGTIVNGQSHARGGVNVFGDNGQYFGNVEGNEAMFVLKKDATAEIAAYSRLNESYGGRSFTKPSGSHFADGGQMSGVDIAETVQEEIRRTPIIVRVAEVETGMTDYNNVKQAGVV